MKLNPPAIRRAFVMGLTWLCVVSPISMGCTSSPFTTEINGYLMGVIRDAPRESLPNIVLVLADDLDFTLDTINYMPNLQELLIQQGISFTNFFVPLSLCCPSRVTILRGQYGHNHQVYTNEPPAGGYTKFQNLKLEIDTIATALKEEGYQTLLIGKYLNNYDETHVPLAGMNGIALCIRCPFCVVITIHLMKMANLFITALLKRIT
jgi:hypothetical protein